MNAKEYRKNLAVSEEGSNDLRDVDFIGCSYKIDENKKEIIIELNDFQNSVYDTNMTRYKSISLKQTYNPSTTDQIRHCGYTNNLNPRLRPFFHHNYDDIQLHCIFLLFNIFT